MSLQRKLLYGALMIIFLWSGVYLILSLSSAKWVFDRYEGFVQKQMMDQLQNTLIDYYQVNGNSWENVNQYVLPVLPQRVGHPGRVSMALMDQAGKLIAVWPHRGDLPLRETELSGFGVQMPLQLEGNSIGTLWLPESSILGLEGPRSRLNASMVTSIVATFAISSLLAIVLSYLLANRIARPLKQLAEAALTVKNRRFDLRLPVTSKDEVGAAIQAFNEMSEELQRGEQVRRNLVADVAHELRTPLTVIQGQLESIQQGVLPVTMENVLPIHDEVIRLSGLVDDLRHLTLAEAGQLPLRLVPTNVVTGVQRVVENFRVIAEGRSIELDLPQGEENLVLNLDPDRLTQILVNLLGNALRYSPEGGRIQVGVRGTVWMREAQLARFCEEGLASLSEGGKPEGILIWVADGGPGIEPEHLQYIFDRFYRSDSARDREGGGAGLGLAIAREFVLAQRGLIGAANRREGGSCFAFILPMGDEPEVS